VRLITFGRSDLGRVRAENQDRLMAADLAAGAVVSLERDAAPQGFRLGPVEMEVGAAGAVLLVADGMGGRAGGARASTLATEVVAAALHDGTSDGVGFPERLSAALVRANTEIHTVASGDPQLAGMGTTATLAGVLDGHVHVAQVGDSRAYLVRNGSAGRLTRDQSLLQDMIDSGVLSEEDAKSVPNNTILQAVGAAAKVRPALTRHPLRRGDMLLLCSDGLSGVVSDAEIAEAASRGRDGADVCDALIRLANARGGRDNVTVLVAVVDGDGVDPPGPGEGIEPIRR